MNPANYKHSKKKLAGTSASHAFENILLLVGNPSSFAIMSQKRMVQRAGLRYRDHCPSGPDQLSHAHARVRVTLKFPLHSPLGKCCLNQNKVLLGICLH